MDSKIITFSHTTFPGKYYMSTSSERKKVCQMPRKMTTIATVYLRNEFCLKTSSYNRRTRMCVCIPKMKILAYQRHLD